MNGKIEPVDVRIVKSPEELTSLAVEFGAWSNFTVPQIGTNTGTLPPILSRRPTRDEAYIFIPPQTGGATSVVLAHRADYVSNASNPQGAIIPVPGAGATAFQIKYKGQQPVYAVGVGGPATISTLDQAQSASEAQAEEIPEYLDEEYELEGQGGPGPSYQ
jgi:hypothetical protein